jgi:Nitrile hydratase beta subunit
MTFEPGTRVRARVGDHDGHTRLPRYVRGQVGQIIEAEGDRPLPDDVASGQHHPRVETVYAVRFEASDLWGCETHTVTVDLWESYLEHAR